MTSHIIPIPPHNNIEDNVEELYNIYEEIAQKNVQRQLIQTADYEVTDSAKFAIVRLEQLKITRGDTIEEIHLRRRLFREIETHSLWTEHPNEFESMIAAIEAQGVSQSEYSNICDLCDIIFPYLENNDHNIQRLWENIGKSKFRELTPFLKRAINNEPSRSYRVEQIFQNEIKKVTSTHHAQEHPITEEETRQMLIEHFLDLGHLSVREFRKHLHPEQRPAPKAYQVPLSDTRMGLFILADQDEFENLRRRLPSSLEVIEVNQDELQASSVFQEIKDVFTGKK